MNQEKLFIGLDIGTQGVRGVAVTADGRVIAGHSVPFASLNLASPDMPDRREQSPLDWWNSTVEVLKAISSAEGEIVALSLDGTSGSLVAVDEEGNPLGNALMYNDARSGDHRSPAEEGKTALDFL